jgi:putative Ca2+/H+ antiporter (TMEM165/GDT1 family)
MLPLGRAGGVVSLVHCRPAAEFCEMEAFLTSTALVALAEIGDKTQLLAIVLATRFKRPVPIILGILAATLANHALAALVGAQASALLQAGWFQIVVALSFIVMGLWTLVPDKLDEDEQPTRRGSAFVVTLVSYFIVEMGDKTQLATVALGARFPDLTAVVSGTTLGMMLANVPAVIFGNALIKRVPMKLVRTLAAALFVAIGGWMLVDRLIR